MHRCRPSRPSTPLASSWSRCRSRSCRRSGGVTSRRPNRRSARCVPPNMSEDLEHFLEYRIADLSADPTAQPWLGRAIVLTDRDGRRVIGSIGFHSPPDEAGQVEVGYRVEPAYGGRGSRPRSSVPCSNGPGASTGSPASAPRPHPTTSPRRRSSPDSASSTSGHRWTNTTARSSCTNGTTGGRPADTDAPGVAMPSSVHVAGRRDRGPVVRHPGRARRRGARRADGCRGAADLPDLDLRAGRCRQAASRLRVRTLAEPHA